MQSHMTDFKHSGSLGSFELSALCQNLFQPTKHACEPILSLAISPGDSSATPLTPWLGIAWESIPWDPCR